MKTKTARRAAILAVACLLVIGTAGCSQVSASSTSVGSPTASSSADHGATPSPTALPAIPTAKEWCTYVWDYSAVRSFQQQTGTSSSEDPQVALSGKDDGNGFLCGTSALSVTVAEYFSTAMLQSEKTKDAASSKAPGSVDATIGGVAGTFMFTSKKDMQAAGPNATAIGQFSSYYAKDRYIAITTSVDDQAAAKAVMDSVVSAATKLPFPAPAGGSAPGRSINAGCPAGYFDALAAESVTKPAPKSTATTSATVFGTNYDSSGCFMTISNGQQSTYRGIVPGGKNTMKAIAFGLSKVFHLDYSQLTIQSDNSGATLPLPNGGFCVLTVVTSANVGDTKAEGQYFGYPYVDISFT